MSELVETVETAIEYQIQNHGFGPHVSRAAIAAVAEWLEDGTHGLTDGELYRAARIRKQLEQPK